VPAAASLQKKAGFAALNIKLRLIAALWQAPATKFFIFVTKT
jgi:hypothetical protein